MSRLIFGRAVLWTTLTSLAVILAGVNHRAVGQDSTEEAKPAAAKKETNFRGRLPNYYRTVVDEKQRQAIYKIQEEYAARLAALRDQLAALSKELDEKVTAVLTPEQAKKIQDLAAEAKTKREKKKSETKTSDEK